MIVEIDGQFSESTEWRRQGADFVLTVKNWTMSGRNIWNIYACIYPENPLFKQIADCKSTWDIDFIPFHGGCTYFRPFYESDGIVKYFKIGCDYNHLGDDYFNQADKSYHYPNGEVFKDAGFLFEFFMCKGES